METANMLHMTERVRKPRLSVQIEPLDRAAIEAAMSHFPGVSESFLVRAAIRVGLQEIVQDRAKLATAPVSIQMPRSKR